MARFLDDDVAESAEAPTGIPARNPLQIAWQRKPLVLLGLLVGVAGAFLVNAQRPPVYQSAAQVLVVKKRSDVLPIAGGDPRAGYYEDFLSTHLTLIRSPLVVEKAVRKRDLGALESFAGADPVAAVAAGLVVARDTKDGASNIINLTFRGPRADDCGAVLNAVIDSYKDFLEVSNQNVSDVALEQIKKAQEILDRDLLDKRKKYIEFREKSPLVIVPATRDGVSPGQARLGELEGKRLSLSIKIAEFKQRLEAVEAARKEGQGREALAVVAAAERGKDERGTGTAARVAAEQQLAPLLLQLQALLQDFGEDHPQVAALRRRIDWTRAFLRRQASELAPDAAEDPVDAYLKALRQDLAAAELARQSLVRLVEDETKEVRGLSLFEVEEANLREEIAQKQNLLSQTMKRLQEINILQDSGGYNVQAISAPGAGAKVSAGLMQILLAGAAVGLMGGVGLAYLADMADKSFRTPEEIRRRLGFPIVAHVPTLAGDGMPSSPDAPQLDRSLGCVHRPTSPEAEAYRTVRTALYFSARGETHKVIQVTSPNMSDGKTTIAANLALAIAQSGKTVALVDADLRRPRVHTLFGVVSDTGMSSVILGLSTLDEALVPSGVDNLSLLPCGPRPDNPAELLTLPRFEELLGELRARFDFVILDTPPLLAVTDPAIVVPRVDGVLLTIRIGKNGRPAAERAREILTSLDAVVLGVVVNGVGREGVSYGYGYGQYQYGYEYAYTYNYVPNDEPGEKTNGAAAPRAARNGRKKKGPSRGWLNRLMR